jgi:multisubunit Na+/H+ antiporter MnhF subunit
MLDSPATVPPTSAATRALRFWALLDGVYAALVALLAIFAVPWKSPFFNVAALIWAATLAGGAPFLWRGRRFAHRLAVITSLIGIAAAVLAVIGFVASWAYLRAA